MVTEPATRVDSCDGGEAAMVTEPSTRVDSCNGGEAAMVMSHQREWGKRDGCTPVYG